MAYEPLLHELAGRVELLKDTHEWNPSEVVVIMAAFTPIIDYHLVEQLFDICELGTRFEAINALTEMGTNGPLKSNKVGEYTLPRGEREKRRAHYESLLEAHFGFEPEPELADASQQLSRLIASLSNGQQRNFCEEALKCSRAGAYRSSIVMAWNFAIDHLIIWIIDEQSRITKFNSILTTEWINKAKQLSKPPIATRDDLGSLKESDIIRIAKASKLIDKSTFATLDYSLRLRNDAAHPFNAREFSAPLAAGHLVALLDFVLARPILQS